MHHPDREFADYIVRGLRDGFRIGLTIPIMASAQDHPEVVWEYLAKECSEGKVIGPLDPACFPMVHTSRIGVIPNIGLGR